MHEIAPRGLVDLHNHVLFGVDDGARSIDDSVAMLRGLARLGYVTVAVSPHFDAGKATPSLSEQRAILAAIDAQRTAGELPVTKPGAEILFNERFLDPASEALWPPIGGEGRSFLVELGMQAGALPTKLEEHVFRLTARGLTLVLAHPERMADVQRDRPRLAALRSAGMVLQLDVLSLIGRYGGKAQSVARACLEDNGYDIVASDIHKPDDLPLLERALLALYDDFREAFERLTSLAPRLVLEGRAEELPER